MQLLFYAQPIKIEPGEIFAKAVGIVRRSAIPVGTPQLVEIELPLGTPVEKVVKIPAKDFTGKVPTEVVLVPEIGPRRVFTGEMGMAEVKTTSSNANVTAPVGVRNRLYVWTS